MNYAEEERARIVRYLRRQTPFRELENLIQLIEEGQHLVPEEEVVEVSVKGREMARVRSVGRLRQPKTDIGGLYFQLPPGALKPDDEIVVRSDANRPTRHGRATVRSTSVSGLVWIDAGHLPALCDGDEVLVLVVR